MKPYLIHHMLDSSCKAAADKVCLVEPKQQITFAELQQRAQKLASALKESGAKEGDHIGVFLDKSINQVVAMLATSYAGMVLVLINSILKQDQVLHIVNDCGIKTLVSTKTKSQTNIKELKSAGIKRFLLWSDDPEPDFEDGLIFDQSLSNIENSWIEPSRITDDTSHIIYTSGSTGLPKGIVLSHRNAIDGAKIVSSYTKVTSDDKILGILPFNFDYGFNQLMNTLYKTATIYLHQFFLPNDTLRLISKEKITYYPGMPPIWSKIFNPKLVNWEKAGDLSSLRALTNTGGRLTIPVIDKMKEHLPSAEIYSMYGLTEAFRSTFLPPEQIHVRPDSIGKAIPNCQILVINDAGKECGPDEEGELVHRGALISKGYWNNPEKTAQVFKPNPLLGDENKHLETLVFSGDVVKKDSEGFIYYVGRKDHMIKTKGYRVSPTEIEKLVVQIDGVTDCVATGFENDGEISVRLFVQFNNSEMTVDELKKSCKKSFPFYLVPDEFVSMKQFPLTANGKVDRNKIINEFKGE